ncbi:MAG: 16S rRNA (cytosine(967)-C(5))-methyltransferase RsmB [Clostridiaceae bacterium]|nr:16S rRNA (cytosine(967)-C(5))-methyltransferase RsmB [Clostridiaceae bacterium]
MKKIDEARDAAVRIVHKVLREGAYSNIAVKQELDEGGLGRLDKALITEIANGTLRNLTRIDWVRSQFVKKNKIEPWIEDIIRCGIYQIIFLDRVPDSAVCNESSELARKYSHEGTVKFVNGVLRNISRSKEKLEYPDKDKDAVKFLSVFYSHPEWIVEKWMKDYGKQFTEELLKANNETPAFTIRCNRLKTSRQELMTMLLEESIECSEGSYNPEAIYIRGTSAIYDKASFKKGYYQVQDESSMLVAHIMDPKPGEVILDMCSAPGGKTTHIAELMDNKGEIVARDVHKHKLKLVEENCSRLGVNIVRTELYNGMLLYEGSIGKFDKVLLDAPCSGLGIMRRKPDIRWKKEPENFRELAKLQRNMLELASKYVKSGGALIYSTCTINKTENIEVVKDFLSNNQQFHMGSITEQIPEGLVSESTDKGYLELFPNIHGTDGFFIARICKTLSILH